MERLTAVAASPDGALLAAGGASGAVYIWEAGSGRLLRSWAAHYKAVTALTFTTSAAILVTGAEDTLVHAWLMCDLLDATLDSNAPAFARPAPMHTWSDHSLPVTGLAVGTAGCEAACLILSSSLDRSVKIHRMSDGALLAAVTLPVAAMCVTMDAGEHCLYVGGADGTIYEVSLVGEIPELGSNKAGNTSNTSALQGGTGASAAEAFAGGSGLGGLGAGAASASLVPHAKMQGHSRAVNALAVSIDGELLVSGEPALRWVRFVGTVELRHSHVAWLAHNTR
jgi:pre-rRNA-processing protein IPI3